MSDTPETCSHEDLERVGSDEVVCLTCHRVAWIFDLIDRGLRDPAAWRPL